ncbi:NrfD/PsrC family molybdoenzyme membrane anchor subunit [Sulfurospirillum sp. 1612]|uniref:NrfD/PsrC family molybdoenzyme membrane anchor subunit n=1 Tax=Sulfurospirillum sp. 1612 TaxID=3094835 RepID=UPI002F9576D5
MSNNIRFAQKRHDNVWLVLSLLVAAVGVYGMVQVFLYGQEASYGVSREVPWGILIIGYSFFVGITLGTAVVGALAHVFKIEAFNIMSKKVALVSLSSLIAAFFIIFWDLGGPFKLQVLRLVVYFTEFKISSPIWWLVVLYASELPFLALEVYFLLSKKANSAFFASLIGSFLGLIAYGTMALVFDSNGSRPLWHTSSFALFFIISAIAGGFAVVLLMIFLSRSTQKYQNGINALSKALFFFLSLMLIIDFWNIVINSYTSDTELGATMKLFVNGGVLSHNFYYYEVLIGMVIPIILLVLGRFKSGFLGALAGLFVLFGLFFARYDAVIGGQLLARPSNDVGLIQYSYSVTATELSLFICSIGIVGVVYFLGAKFFNLEEEARHE